MNLIALALLTLLPPDDGYKVGSLNPILEIYVGEKQTDGKRELVFELESMKFQSNDRNYGCIFVNGRIVMIKEVNKADSYVRGHVLIPDAGAVILAYAGVVTHADRVDPHNHKALWKAFIDSDSKVFHRHLMGLPRWWVNNPIRARGNGKPVGRLESSKRPEFSQEEKPQRARQALHPDTTEHDRFMLVWGLATSGYSPESADALVKIACDSTESETTRGYAAMGLSNFTLKLPAESKADILRRLQGALEREKGDCPDSILRTILAWGGSADLLATIGKDLRGHSMEIEVLKTAPSEVAIPRLWRMVEAAPKSRKSRAWMERTNVGYALIAHQDKRGVDILVESIPLDKSPSGQHSNNVFHGLVRLVFHQNFGYNSANYHPSLGEAIPQMARWWSENRESFTWDGAQPKPDRR